MIFRGRFIGWLLLIFRFRVCWHYLVGGHVEAELLPVAEDEVVEEEEGEGVAPMKKSSDTSSTLPKWLAKSLLLKSLPSFFTWKGLSGRMRSSPKSKNSLKRSLWLSWSITWPPPSAAMVRFTASLWNQLLLKLWRILIGCFLINTSNLKNFTFLEMKFALVRVLVVTHVDLFSAHCCCLEFVVFKAGRQPDATKTPASVASL